MRPLFVALFAPFLLFALGFFTHAVWSFIALGWRLGTPPH